MTQQQHSTIKQRANYILSQVRLAARQHLPDKSRAILTTLAGMLELGELDGAAAVCGAFKGHYQHTQLDLLLRVWQQELWEILKLKTENL